MPQLSIEAKVIEPVPEVIEPVPQVKEPIPEVKAELVEPPKDDATNSNIP